MTFDPFGDFATRGYLRNHAGQKDMAKVKDLEHDAFRGNVERALHNLSRVERLSFEDVKKTHETLFGDVYPWADQDRSQNARDLHVTKGAVEFMFASHVGRGVDYALGQGNDAATMREKPGEVMGNLAYAHPFLDGNGRTIMTVHTELCRRAGIHIDWSQTNKNDYLNALTRELEAPGKGHLDAYLKPYVRSGAIDRAQSADALRGLPGLGPEEKTMTGQPILPARTLDSAVSKTDLDKALEQSDYFRETSRNLDRMAAGVYRDPSKMLDAVRETAMSGKIGDRDVIARLSLDPEAYGPYKGAGGVFSSREERMDYRRAIAGRTGLRGVADDYISLVHGIRQTLAQEKHELAERGKVEIAQPSAALMSAIEKKQPLSDDQKTELSKSIRSFEKRFGDDIGRLRTARNLAPIAEKHGANEQQLATARTVLKTLDKGDAQVRNQARELNQSQSLGKGGPSR
nr:cell filamentation protein [uncultured bacterium]BAH89385.1 cell filamentation protein [uncultured bacterium]BAH89493.1 cell filamentation protein [uncultured bacterium]BAH89688.1 cell filamentation protein [uncultured bacterium]BAH89933.1 cell filamentation protein [uncultured bacterium]